MLCTKCNQRPANVTFIQNINGAKTQYHLCEQCASQSGITPNAMFPPVQFDNLYTGFLPQAQTANVCPTCHLSFDEFSRGGKFGCEDCYDQFGTSLPTLMQRLHGSTHHIPSASKPQDKEQSRPQTQLAQLQLQLQQSVAAEDYETAAVLRDKIKQIKGA